MTAAMPLTSATARAERAIRHVEAPRRRPAQDRARPTTSTPRPELRLLPRPRAAANAVILLVGVIAVLMLAAVVLHTRLAERQLQIDELEQEVDDAHERFDVLRQQRAELRSPTRLALEAAGLNMTAASDSRFLTPDGGVYAGVLVAVGGTDIEATTDVAPDPLDQIRRIRESEDG